MKVRFLVTKWSDQDIVEIDEDEYKKLTEKIQNYEFDDVEEFLYRRGRMDMDTVSIEITVVDKDRYMKAIKQLLMYKDDILADARQNGHFPFLDDVNEAIAELEQLQSKLQSLEQYCEEQIDTWESQENGDHKVYEKILTKLRS